MPEHHDARRKPATYTRILENIRDREINIHWTITGPMLKRPGYLEEYVAFWQARPEVNRIWVSLYSPQQGEHTSEMLTKEERQQVARELPALRESYPKLLMSPGIGQALLEPPQDPRECLFSKMSTNYSADLATRVEPCIFGGTPDCSQCGCIVSSGLHYVQKINLVGPLKIGHLVRTSTAIGSLVNRVRSGCANPSRWKQFSNTSATSDLVQIGSHKSD